MPTILLIPLFVLFVEITDTNYVAVLVGDTAKAHAVGSKPHAFPLVGVVQPVVLVAVEGRMHAKTARQIVDCLKAVRVAAWSFMGYQDIRMLPDKPGIFVWKDCAAMLACTLIALCFDRWPVGLASLKGCIGIMLYIAGGMPYFAKKHTAKPRNACASDFNYTAMQIAVGQRR